MTTVEPTRADDDSGGAKGRIRVPGPRRGEDGEEGGGVAAVADGHGSDAPEHPEATERSGATERPQATKRSEEAKGAEATKASENAKRAEAGERLVAAESPERSEDTERSEATEHRNAGERPARPEAGKRPESPEPSRPTGPQTVPAPPSRATGRPAKATAPTATRLGSALRRVAPRPVRITLLVAAVLHIVWFLLFANSGGDLAAQDAWAEFAGRHPDSAYNLAWYGGMHPVSYSVISPYLMHVLGVRTTMMIVGTVSCGLLAFILTRSRGVERPLPPALAGTFAFICNAVSGRVTFGLGAMFALGAVALVFSWPRTWRSPSRMYVRAGAAAVLAGLATAGSPVAGLFLGVLAAALFLDKRRPAAYALGVTPVIVVGLSAWLFPFSGTQPMSFSTVVLPFLSAVAALLLVPAEWRTVRISSAVYALGVLLTWIIDSQIGSNVTRLALVFAGVVFVAALPKAPYRSRRWAGLCVALATVTAWQTVKTVDDVVNTTPEAAWARELAPLVHQLNQGDADRGRVEVVPARSHREASALAPYVNLARGWNRQADRERNPLFYEEGMLTPGSYHIWLKRWAVRYVVLPKDEPDGAGADEARLIEAGQPYLRKVWSDANWKLYRVVGPTPLADPPASVQRAGAGELIVTVPSAGPVLIRIPYSPWLGLVDGDGKGVEPPAPYESGEGFRNLNGCLTKEVQYGLDGAPEDEWTLLHAPRAGTYRIAAPYQLPRGTPCPDAN
ncbi:MFS transporter [Streptomyces sp. 8N706]|uniref:MFS transporter n=1 Tax=Streptomyces sp. 8N706 TaxID=3457416 RepID=UPI003FD450C2